MPETRPIRFHMHLLPTYFPDRDAPFEVYYQQILEQVQLAEELGFECFWFTEHHFLLYGGPLPNPALFMAAAAVRTSRIRFGSAISILPLHHPVQTAEDYAMLDVTSGGRLEFGVGLGNTVIDFEGYGIPREERRERFDEAIEIILKLWSNERASHAGRHWQFPELPLYPRPVQRPHPPVWVAGSSPESLGWAGQRGYNIMTVAHPVSPEAMRPGVTAWQQALREAGHDDGSRHCLLNIRLWVDERADRARETAVPALERYHAISRVGRTTAYPGEVALTDWDKMLAQGRVAFGDPDQCIQAIRNAQAHYHFDVMSTAFNFGGLPHQDIMRAMRLFAREVVPAFA